MHDMPLGAPAPCEALTLSARLERDEGLLALILNMFPGWKVELRTVKVGRVREDRRAEVWWWAKRREAPTKALRMAGVMPYWFARPTGDDLLTALTNQLKILHDHRG